MICGALPHREVMKVSGFMFLAAYLQSDLPNAVAAPFTLLESPTSRYAYERRYCAT